MTALISEEYLDQQRVLHAVGDYGYSGHKYASVIDDLASKLETTDILDYGCGRRTLESSLGYLIRNYDPAIPEFSASPDHPADILACTDVLEHIEPELLGAVLDDIKRLTRKMCVLVIATGPAKKILPDGRNAHLIQMGADYWLPKIMQRFVLLSYSHLGKAFLVVGKVKK